MLVGTKSESTTLDPHYDVIVERHTEALRDGLPNYADPLSGFRVFTAGFLARRGYCCESGCRHCPFVSGT